jgi:hypothetical protein
MVIILFEDLLDGREQISFVFVWGVAAVLAGMAAVRQIRIALAGQFYY